MTSPLPKAARAPRSLDCRCGHPQNRHERAVGRCLHGCGCESVNLHPPGRGLAVLEQLDAARTGKAPRYRVRCRSCNREYVTTSFLREIVGRKACRGCSDTRKKRARKAGAGASRPADLPAARSFSDRPHGVRVRYMSGCRCDLCREANNAYERMRGKLRRAGQANPLVRAWRVRRHLLRLSRAGVGRRTVSDVAGVPESTVCALRSGKKTKLRTETARRLLAVSPDVVTDAKLVSAQSTWKLIGRMLEEGFTKGAIALALGMKTRNLRLRRDRVTARTRARVWRLYRELCG